MWMVRNPQGKHADELIKAKAVGIGWPRGSPLPEGREKCPKISTMLSRKHTLILKGQEIVNAGRQLYKFFREIKDGDTVVTYNSPEPKYHVGIIGGAVRSDPEVDAPFSNIRTVNWQHEVDRDTLSQAARNSLGSTLTIFEPSEEAEQEFEKGLQSQTQQYRLRRYQRRKLKQRTHLLTQSRILAS